MAQSRLALGNDIGMHHLYLAALVLFGMGLAFLVTDHRTPTSRALGAGLMFGGLSIVGNGSMTLVSAGGIAMLLMRLIPTLDTLAILLAFEWVARMRCTIPERTGLNTRFGDGLVRVAQLLVVLYWGLAMVYPEQRHLHFLGGLENGLLGASHWFYLFTLPLDLAVLCAGGSMILLLNRRLDGAERKRLIAMCIALPVMLSGYVVPQDYAPFVTITGAMILLIGAIQFHTEQGRRSEFLGRFLSPDVADMVREKGLDSVRRETRTVSVLHCDIRGFTHRCRELDSEQILELLKQFYTVVGQCCERHGATIKDYAGDGVMMLVGAPLPVEQPARQALDLAEDLQRDCTPLLYKWSSAEAPLGLAVGIATGAVTLGVIGAMRLEYVAVGSAVNFAARLCESAAAGEILFDAPLPSAADSAPARLLQLKGFGDAVPAYRAGVA